ncbi:MAG: FecR domain-containing protein [Elusimicrobia bacterium]|nr:FecR domain-containing protein [Elusimicrobiota bacterium]
MFKLKTAVFVLLALSLSPALRAQDEEGGDGQDYRKMMQEMLKANGSSQGQSESWDARLKVVSGTVMVKPANSEEWSKITGEIPLESDDAVKTESDGVAELYLDDKGAIALGRNTQVDMTSLEQGDSVFTLNFGSLTAKIKKFLNEKFKMQVRTPSAVCAVRGTEFAVEYSQMGKETSVAVYDEGRVAVTPEGEGAGSAQEYTLEKNTEISFGPNNKRFRPVALAKMARYRGGVAQMRGRVAAFKNWKPRSQARRAALRDQALKRKIIRRQLKDRKQVKGKARRKARATRRQAPPPEQEGEIEDPGQ